VPLLDPVGNMRFDLLDRLHVMTGPITPSGSKLLAELYRAGGRSEALGERVTEPVLHQNMVAASPGVAALRVLAAIVHLIHIRCRRVAKTPSGGILSR
jgi:hypothetical protein